MVTDSGKATYASPTLGHNKRCADPPSYPFEVEGAFGFFANDEVIVCGGSQAFSEELDISTGQCHAYSPASGAWTSKVGCFRG